MPITAAQANAQLVNVNTVDDLRSLISQLDISNYRSTTILYSGGSAHEMALALADQNSDIRIIDRTQAAIFLDTSVAGNEALKQKLSSLFGADWEDRGSAGNRFLYGTYDANGVRISADGAWDDVSRRFAAATVGDVRVIAPNANSAGIFGATELPALLSNPAVTSIEGISPSALQAASHLSGVDGPQAVFNRVRLASEMSIVYGGMSATALPGGGLSIVAGDFLDPDVLDVNVYLESHPEAHARMSTHLQSLDPSVRAERATLIQNIIASGEGVTLSSGVRVLNKLGVLALVAGFALAAEEASAAEGAGNSEQAREIMKLWAVDLAGSTIGEVAGAAIGAIAVAAAAAVGTVISAPLAGALIFGAALVGGIFGAEGATQVYQMTKDLDENGHMDLLDKLGNLLFGVSHTIVSPLPADLNGQRLTLDATFSREDLVANATSGTYSIAWRYALRELNPFVITDISYEQHNGDGSLDLYDTESDTGAMTEAYLADRAAMLTWKIRYDRGMRDENDGPRVGPKSYTEDWDTSEVRGNWDFVDLSIRLPGGAPLTLAIDGQGISLHDHQVVFGSAAAEVIEGAGDSDRLYGGGGNDTLSGLGGADYMEGGAGNDTLTGGAGDDTLLGGAGIDELHGGANNDLLRGGAGADIYVIDGSVGNDTIIDDDGGFIRYKTNPLIGGRETATGSGVWQDAYATYRIITEGADQHLHISAGAGTVLVRDWTNGKFGIQLDGYVAPQPPEPQTIFVGDLAPVDQDPQTEGVQVAYNALGNVIVNPSQAEPNRADTLNDGADDDELRGYGGDDILHAWRGGHDLLDGGTGNDYLRAGAGEDTLIGGEGFDRILGQAGDDKLFAEAEQSDAQVQADHHPDTEDEDHIAAQGDLLSGGDDNDRQVGGRRADLLYGGEGRDTLWGGAGDDVIYGDSDASEAQSTWTVQRQVLFDAETDITTYQVTTTGLGFTAGSSAGHADVLYGGAGADWLFGEGGQDQLHGGGGQDVLFGGGDSDWLQGGEGDDVMHGDDGVATGSDYGHDLLSGGAGNDKMDGDAGHDVLFGGDGNDFLTGDGRYIAVADQGNDYLDGGADNDTLYGYAGNDTLIGGTGNDELLGDSSEEFLAGEHHGEDLLDGGEGADSLYGFGGSDTLLGGVGNDWMDGDAPEYHLTGAHHGDDSLEGGEGNDTMFGSGGSDTLLGGQDNDYLHGDAELSDVAAEFHGDDSLDGGQGDDTLLGGGGNDTLIGGSGVDFLKGGLGDDTYVFQLGDSVVNASQQSDTVEDSEGNNLLRFEGLDSEDVSVSASGGSHLVLSWGQNNRVVVSNGLSSSNNRYAFADGVTLSHSELIGRFAQAPMIGTTAGGTRLVMGGRQVDTLAANQVGDTLSGGRGDDIIQGSGGGLHTYLYSLGDGADSLVDTSDKVDLESNPTPNRLLFGEGIALADVRLSGHQGQLRVLVGNDTQDSITFAGFDASQAQPSPIDLFEFANGTVLTYAQMLERGFDGDATAEDIMATSGDDRVEGQGGNDTLRGAAGNDTIAGGAGDDVLIGGDGADTYLYGAQDGVDTIQGTSTGPAIDTVVFGPGITINDIRLSHDNGDLVLQVGSSVGNAIRVSGFNAGQATLASLVGTYVFSDDTEFTHEQLVGLGFTFGGTAGSEVLNGTNIGDRFLASSGNDTLRGGTGSDDYHWSVEAGDDRIEDSGTVAQGLDRLVLDSSILVADIRVSRAGDDLLVWVTGNEAQIRVENHFVGQGVEQLVFGDNTVWDKAHIESMVAGLWIEGSAGHDVLIGTDGDDTLIGALGNDTLQGGLGSDDYRWGVDVGDDRIEDTGTNAQGIDRVVLHPSIEANDLRLMRVGNDLELRVNGSASVLVVAQQFAGRGVEQLVMGDGAIWDNTQIESRSGIALTGGNDSYIGTANNDYVIGLGGNDLLQGNDGDDTLNGGEGNDTLYGQAGNDTLIGGPGSDLLAGGDGDDTLIDGEDMQGGQGSDTYIIEDWPLGYIYINESTGADFDRLRLSVASTDVRVGRLYENTSWATTNDLLLTTTHIELQAIVLKQQLAVAGSAYKIEEIEFSDGVIWSAQDIHLRSLLIRANAYVGHNWGETIQMEGLRAYAEGMGGDDIIIGRSGVDTIYGGDGNDTLQGMGGADSLLGGVGQDLLIGGDGNDKLIGDVNDTGTSRVGDGHDTLQGGHGDDILMGNGGNDVYRVARGDGDDTIIEFSGQDTLQLTGDILSTDVQLFRDGNDLLVSIDQSATQTRVKNHFLHTDRAIENIQFSDSASWNSTQIAAMVVPSAANTMVGTSGDDVFVVDHASDQVVEQFNQGNDLVQSSVTYSLGANIENLTLTGFLSVGATGNELNNHLIGNGGNNTLHGGSAGADTLAGGAGNDTYYITGLDDTVVELAGGGIDTVYTQGSYTLTENVENLIAQAPSWQNNLLFEGNSLDNTIEVVTAGENFHINGGEGADTMISHVRGATFFVDNIQDKVISLPSLGGIIESTISWSLTNTPGMQLRLNGENLSGTGTHGVDFLSAIGSGNVLSGLAGDDQYTISWSETLQAYSAQVLEAAGGGDDEVIMRGSARDHYASDFEHVERITLSADAGASNVYGNAAANRIRGNGAANSLYGGAGDDHIESGGSQFNYGLLDWLYGEEGNDTLVGGSGTVFNGGAGNDQIEIVSGNLTAAVIEFGIGDGEDSIYLASYGVQTHRAIVRFASNTSPADLKVLRTGTTLTLEISANDRLVFGNFFNNEVDLTHKNGLMKVDFASGLSFNLDVLLQRMQSGNTNVGTSQDDLYFGSGQGDQYDGEDGHDIAWGDGGEDDLAGGSGNDTLYGGEGADSLFGNEGADLLEGGAGNDVLVGGDGDDLLKGGQGDDTLTGGAGADQIYFEMGLDVIRFARGDGHDSIMAAYSWDRDELQKTIEFAADILPGDVTLSTDSGSLVLNISGGTDSIRIESMAYEQLQIAVVFANGTMWGSQYLLNAARTISGDAGANSIEGTYGADRILGLGGNDTLVGYDGNDDLDGGEGVDSMIGGWGDDTYWVDHASDIVVESSNQGHDKVYSSVTHTLRTNVEDLELTGTANLNGTGNASANRIVGNSGNNSLSGAAGADTLEGGLGDDTYVVDNVGDVVVEVASEGTDLVQSSVSHTLSANVENLTLTGSSAINGTGNDLANHLRGNTGANTLTGGLGNDTLDGGTGADSMLGGGGDDSYVVERNTDVVVELANEGIDTVSSSVTWTLGSHVENLTLTGSSAIHGYGNTEHNYLVGNSGNNSLRGYEGNDTLDGGSGTDTMIGGVGDDTYFVERTADVVTENANEGDDTVRSTVTLTLGSNVENLVLLGSSGIHGTGNTLNNHLIGNTGANSLSGGAGHDTLHGLAGSDTLIGGAGNDTYLLGRGDGSETVQENDSTSGNTDILRFLEDVAADQVWFRRVSNNLEVSIIGTSDKATVTNWYSGNQYKLEQFQTSGGQALLSSQVDNLVNAMASFSPPAAGQTTLPTSYAASLTPVISANWT